MNNLPIFMDRNWESPKEIERQFSKGNLIFEGQVLLEHFRKGQLLYREKGKNIVTNEGIDHILNVVLGATAKISTWYVGIFKGNVTPVAGDTAASAAGSGGSYTECQDADYDAPATNRPEYIDAPSTAKKMTNTASPASFTIAASITVYGALLISSQAKTATSGTLMAAKRFAASRAVVDDDVLQVTYEITGSSS